MKKKIFTLVMGWLLFLSSNLLAQNTEGLFKLKEGDWFEVRVEQPEPGLKINDQMQKHLIGSTFLLNYQLKKHLENGNQQYNIRLEHFKIIKKHGDRYFGYDSYYPTFEENRANPETKNEFNLEVTPSGEIVRFTASKTNESSEIKLTEIGYSNLAMGTATYNESNTESLMIHLFSNYLMLKDSLPKTISLDSESIIPLLIKRPDMQLFLTDASFTISNNTIIQGKLKDQINQEIKISLKGENEDFYFPEKQFRTNNDGSFNCPIFLKRPFHLRVQIGNKSLTTFMEPGDTLNILAIGHQTREIQYNQYAETKPNEYYATDLKKSDYFSGNAAYNTMLSNELDQYRNEFESEDNVNALIAKGKGIAKAVKQLIDSYNGKATDKCIAYFQSDFQYLLASQKLDFYSSMFSSYRTDNGNRLFHLKVDYPNDFFLDVDTLPILMNPNEWNSFYQNFIQRAQIYKRNRVGMSTKKYATLSFLDNYFFSQVSLKGYPLYKQIAKSIDTDLRNGITELDIINKYYTDFFNNCADPALTEPLKKVYETAMQLKIGNKFPIKSFVLQDSSIFRLDKYKGKPICLVLFDGSKSRLNVFKEEVEKYRPEEVEFIFVRTTKDTWIGGEEDSTLWKKPNVKYIELPEKYLKSELLLDRTKIFMLDKWFRILENNAEDPMTHKYKGRISEFEKSLRKTIETKRYSKAEKTAMIKTAGWSFSSILITFLGGLWIYRIRVRRIKTQEAAKRRIKELEIKAIRSQMNPHFIFNALNSIQSLINGNQFREANIYLSKFAVLLRGVLNNSEKNRISLADELQAVELYCQLEQLRFEFSFHIGIEPDLKVDLIEIPGMIIQPLVENAVVHGLSGKGASGELDIQVKRLNGNLCVCVSDNGVGLSETKIDELSQKGFGLKLVEERINILNLDGKEARLTLENRSDVTGTLATLIIPID